MKIAINQATTMPHGFKQDVKSYAAAGFTAIELWLDKVRAFLEQNTFDDARDLLADYGLLPVGALLSEGEDELRKRPLFMTGTNAEPPLRIARDGAEILIDAAMAGVPVSLGSYYLAGATGPLHVAAGIVQRTATLLTGLVLTQAAAPGSCYDFSCQSGWCDLKTGDAITMSPDVMRIVAGSIQMGRHYGLPTHAMACTDAMAPDARAAGERFFALAVSVMCGASVIHHATSCMAGMELADVEEEARQCIEAASAGGGFILASGDGVILGTPFENIFAMVEAAQKYGKCLA